MTSKDTTIRTGVAAFVVGLALAGPQAAGIASADRDRDGSTASSAAEGRDGTGMSAPAEEVDTGPATPAAPDGIDGPNPVEEPALDEPPVDELEPTGQGDVVMPGGDSAPAPELEAGEPPVSGSQTEVGSDESRTEPEAFAEPEPLPAPESESDEPPVSGPRTEVGSDENRAEPDAFTGPESLPDALPAPSPGRVGPDPLSRWRTAAVPTAAEAVSPPEPASISGLEWLSGTESVQAPGPADQPASGRAALEPPRLFAGVTAVPAVGELRAGVAQFIDTVIAWLDGLPANPFTPVTEFISGALLLVRRALVPEYSACAAAAGAATTSDCSGGIRWEVPEFQDPYGTTRSSQWAAKKLGNYPTTFMPEPWYTTSTVGNGTDGAAAGATLLRATKDTPIEIDSWAHRSSDGVKGMIKNFSKQIVLVEVAESYTAFGSEIQQAVLLPGDELPYTLSASATLSNSLGEQLEGGKGGVLSFYALDRYGRQYFGPVRLKIVDPTLSRPGTAFAPANSDYVNTRESWHKGDEHHELWGGTSISVKREEDGWTIPYSDAWYKYKQLSYGTDEQDEQLINSSAQSDWAIFTIHINGL